MPLSERLEIRLDHHLMRKLRKECRRKEITISEYIRELLISNLVEEEMTRKKAAEQLCSLNGPVDDWEKMKQEIESGYSE